jgi:muconate cycloisomerase
VKVGLNPPADVERVRAVRQAVGAGVKIGIDANTGWSVQDALWAVPRMRECDLWFIEQPIHGRNVAGLAEIRRQTGIAVMADEAVWTPEDCTDVIRQGAADIISVYPGKNGGILNCKKIIHLAEAAGLTCVLGSNLELGIASAAMLHVGCASRGISDVIGHHIIGPLYHQDDLVTPPLQLANATARLTDGPGLGVELDEGKLEQYRTRPTP